MEKFLQFPFLILTVSASLTYKAPAAKCQFQLACMEDGSVHKIHSVLL